MRKPQFFLRRHIAFPQDHGSWVFILSPLAIGLSTGGALTVASLVFILTAMTAFLIRQTVTIAIKIISGRRSREELPAAYFWLVVYGLIFCLSIAGLFVLGESNILLLGIPAVPVFGWHLWLISRRQERHQAGLEIVATGVLALAAPAAFWIGRGAYLPVGWLLWILTWLQSAGSIMHAYLRLEQREWKFIPDLRGRFSAAMRPLAYTFFNLFFCALLSAAGLIAGFLWVPFLVQALETVYGTLKPAMGEKPLSIGMRQLAISIVFTLLFILLWR